MGVIRFAFALLVACSHSGLWLGSDALSPRLAVTGFYVISGFYIQYIITEKYSKEPNWVVKFYGSRVMRLFPLYYIVVAATILLQQITGDAFPSQAIDLYNFVFINGGLAVQFTYIFSNLFILGQDVARLSVAGTSDGSMTLLVPSLDVARSLPAMELTILGQSWSLALELWFYLLAPWLLRRRSAVLVAVAVASAILRIGLMAKGYGSDWRVGPEWINAFFPTELGTFCLGALACRHYLGRTEPACGPWVGAALTAAIVAYLYSYGASLAGFYPWSYFLFPLLVAASLPAIFRATRGWSRDNAIGELSYPLYITHFLFVHLVGGLVPMLGQTLAGLVAVAASVAASAAVLVMIDRPVTRFRHRRFLTASTSSENPR